MIYIVTAVLDGMPWIATHYHNFTKLKQDWEWHIVEGVSANIADTGWCSTQSPRLSVDGTSEYLEFLAGLDTRVHYYSSKLWRGKTEQLNSAIRHFKEDGYLLQVDADELWTAPQIERACSLLGKRNCAFFRCKFYLGPDIITSGYGTWGNRTDTEWLRLWKYRAGQEFITHEPPRLTSMIMDPVPHDETERAGLVFEHRAYATESQVLFKEKYYNEPGLLEGWHQLQQNSQFPTRS